MITHLRRTNARALRARAMRLSLRPALRSRRGIALFISMFFVAGIGALALSAIYLTANAQLLSKTYEKEDDLKYASEAALQIGKAELNFNPAALPNTSYVRLLNNASVRAADGSTVPGIVVSLYAGPTGSTSGQFGRFASVVAEARDPNGTGFVRRLELTQESFAKFAYWSNNENNASGGTIVFANGDAIWGPVFSNDTITIASSHASFHDAVSTAAPVISGANYGTFFKGYQVKQRPITLPSLSSLSTLSGLAATSNYSLPSSSTGDETTILTRVEFIAVDLNSDGDSTDDNEGFFRVYKAASGYSTWLRGDWPGPGSAVTSVLNCGDWHTVGQGPSRTLRFFPAAIHPQSWFESLMEGSAGSGGGAMTTTAAQNEQNATLQTIMSHPNARCYLGGDPHLVAIARNTAFWANSDKQKGGDDTTFTASDPRGAWQTWSGTIPPVVASVRGVAGSSVLGPHDAAYLYPLYRGYNTSTKGVIYSAGSVGVSGVVRGVMTLYSPYTVVILDDLRYANDPAAGVCIDILGTISGANTVVANNGLNTPINIRSNSNPLWETADDTPDLYLHDIVMALGTSFQVEGYGSAPANALTCGASTDGRGCLYLTGGLIQNRRGPVGLTSGEGYVKRYSYDRCAITNPPPYFPTTGRFEDNRYYEHDPVRVNSSVAGSIRALFLSLTGT
jgi:hypothetical protein